ncbi:Site-specific DNA-methyltransferase (adenine-specific) [Thermosinus carboxydivorans Nor1]|uniref:Site-specific DNA-methyltransferase (Adenine-specific) n=1 Tax=Thermosinus carboxydivorans Nor1 TaxID=401526 RepID=A1HQ33_9FIRM|nr:site-specific DNA-methyltransferase [Thermosinus carboxydivorans]EAX47882.1 Site-specific DNA-methyltransferase (adenine-specific) [Thermosinus carboxydivorans Nor1]
MEFPKVQKEIFNPISENVKKLAQVFPSVVKDGQVDFEALKAELGQFETASEKLSERYELGWAGKEDAKRLANTDIVGRTLKYIPEDSKNPDTTENLYIEGDNLEVLKLLRNSYYNKIKMIYIDPPYNTGNDFIYRDDFKVSEEENALLEGEKDEYGERLIVNQKSNGRFHSNWLSMIYPRLKVAKDLLTEDGVIFISIDDNEVHNLKKICDEIFGEENFIACFTWVKKKKGSHLSKTIRNMVEYILLFGKNALKIELFGEEAYSNKWQPLVKRTNAPKTLVFPAKKVETTLNDGIYQAGVYGEGTSSLLFETDIIIKNNLVINEITVTGPFVWTQSKLNEELELGTRVSLSSKFGFNVFRADQDEKIKRPVDILDNKMSVGTNEDAYQELLSIFNVENILDYPKPVSLLKYLINTIGYFNKEFTVLDFFSGSATTAHAVMQLNAEDGGNRKFIMVQLPEPCDEKSEAYKAGFKNICEIGKERIRRAGEKIKEENKDKEGIENLDIGFKVFRVADTNIRWFSEAIKSENMTLEESMMSDKDRLDFNPGFTDIDVVYEILLRHRDIPLSAKVEKLSEIGERTYIFADTVVVCLEENVTESIIDKIATIEPMPMKIIFRDSAFGDDITLKTNTMLRLEAQMKKNSGEKKKAYRVEFI